MNLITITLVIVAVGGSAAGKLSAKYLPPNQGGHQQQQQQRPYHGVQAGTSNSMSGHHYGTQYQGHAAQPSTQHAHHQPQQQQHYQQIPIVRNSYANDGNGNYNFGFETGNGIQRDEVGTFIGGWPNGSPSVTGSYSYTGDDGRMYTVNYTADDTGFHAQGDHLPTPPPSPSAGHHYGGAAQSGHGGGYYGAGHGGAQQYSGSASVPNSQYLPPQRRY